MNIDLRVPGTSFEASCDVKGPDMPSWQLRSFWRSYWATGDREFGMVEFSRLVRMGNIVCIWLLEGYRDSYADDDSELFVDAQFGVQLMRDSDGPYTQFIFFQRDPDGCAPLMDVLPAVVRTAWKITELYSDAEEYGGEQRLYMAGRKGWRRVVKALGIEMRDGWITNQQEAFGHGLVRRQ